MATNKSSTVTSGIEYSPIYTKYYSASDFIIRMYNDSTNKIWLDKATGVAVSESLSSIPVYTIGNSLFQFVSKGNQIVSGVISLNMFSIDYMAKVFEAINGSPAVVKTLTAEEQMALSADALKEYLKKKKESDNRVIQNLSTLGFSDYPLFDIELVYNNSDAITSKTSMSRVISDCRIIGFEQGVDITGDGQLVDGYRFIAREVV